MGLQHFELISLFLQETEGAGKGVLQVAVVPGLEGVVEGDDGAVAGVAHDVGQHLRTAELLAVVAGDEVPHHNLVFPFQDHVLGPAHVAVRRSEQEGAEGLVGRFRVADGEHEVVGFFRILQIAVGGEVFAAEAADVVEGVVADAVAALHNHAELLGMLADVVAHHEEGGFDAVLVQQVEHPRGYYGDGTVVKSQINGFLVGIHPPQSAGVEFAEQFGGLLDEHGGSG